MNMDKYLQNFLKYLKFELNYSELTIINYENEIKKFESFLNDKKINFKKINKDIIRGYLKYLDSKSYNKNSISKNLSSLRSYYKYLCDNKIVDTNYFKNISNPKKDKKLPNFLNYEEINIIFDSINTNEKFGQRNKCVVELLYDTGIRVSELVNIKIRDIDFNTNTILIMGKGSKERIVYFGEYALETIKYYINNERTILDKKQSDYLILNNLGTSITTKGIELIINKVVDNASLKHKISPHVLRHTFATHMLNGGSDIKTVQQLLGHESLSTTGIYTHITSEYLRTEYLKNHPRSKN